MYFAINHWHPPCDLPIWGGYFWLKPTFTMGRNRAIFRNRATSLHGTPQNSKMPIWEVSVPDDSYTNTRTYTSFTC